VKDLMDSFSILSTSLNHFAMDIQLLSMNGAPYNVVVGAILLDFNQYSKKLLTFENGEYGWKIREVFQRPLSLCFRYQRVHLVTSVKTLLLYTSCDDIPVF